MNVGQSQTPDSIVRDICRNTKRKYSTEEKVRTQFGFNPHFDRETRLCSGIYPFQYDVSFGNVKIIRDNLTFGLQQEEYQVVFI